jgi:hypothetical protein
MTNPRFLKRSALSLAVLLFACGPMGERPVITTQALHDGTVGSPWSQTIAVEHLDYPCSGGVLRFASGLPPGLSVPSPDQGSISGTPAQAGDFNVRLSAGCERSDDGDAEPKTLPLKIFPALSITTQSLPGGQVGVAYDAAIEATGGKPPLKFEVFSTLPAGLSLDATTGVISGTPTQSGPSGDLSFVTTDANHAMKGIHLTIGIAP